MFDFESYFPTRILVGNNKIEKIGRLARRYGDSALLVTGRRSMKVSGFTDRVMKLLRSEGVAVELYDKVETNPIREMVNEGGAFARKLGSKVIIGLGGGSALDTAKGIALLGKEGGDIWSYIEGKEISGPILPLICAPSTAGTGSEVTKYAVFSDDKNQRKEGFASDYIIPDVAIIDPELMSTASPELTANAGGDAFAQAVEAYLTKLAHPLSDMFALESIRLCAQWLRVVVSHGNDLNARAAVGWASSLAGIAISLVDVIIGHHVSEAVGALYKTHHGCTAALLLPHAMAFNLSESKQRLARIAEAMGEDVQGESEDSAAQRSVESVKRLLQDIKIPRKLSDIGVKRESIPDLLQLLQGRIPDLVAGNPREITKENIKEFLEMSF